MSEWTPTEVADRLERAAARLEKPGAWTQGAPARNGEGAPVHSLDPHAVCWCVSSAIAVEGTGKSFGAAREVLLARLSTGMIVHWNDGSGRTQAEVVAELRAAAADARASAPLPA